MSHSSVDKPFVERLAADLRTREGIDAWLDKWEIQPGDSIPNKLETGLDDANIFVFVLSPKSVESSWSRHERDAWLTMQVDEEVAAEQAGRTPQRRLIPVLYQDCEKPTFLKPMLHVSITDATYEEGFQALVRGIRGETGKPPLKGESTTGQTEPINQPAASTAKSDTSSSVLPRILAFRLLKSLLRPQFDEVIFLYEIENAYLPQNADQVSKAIEVIKLAKQKEGAELAELLTTIYQVAPHLNRPS